MELKKIDNGQTFDFGKTSFAYAAYRDIYPQALDDRLRALGVAAAGTRWLDLGTGTGVLPKNMYRTDADITGADISAEQISFAKNEAAVNGWRINYIVSPAESTGLPDNSFDVITAAQCFFYFDREKMRTELRRLIKPGGRFIKIFMDWDAQDPIAGESASLVRKWNPAWGSGRAALADMEDDLFTDRHAESFYADIPFTRQSWHGRMLACRGTMASMDAETLAKWEEDHKEFLQRCPAAFTVRHKILIAWFDL